MGRSGVRAFALSKISLLRLTFFGSTAGSAGINPSLFWNGVVDVKDLDKEVFPLQRALELLAHSELG